MNDDSISVLVVDDDPRLLRGLDMQLSDANYKVLTAVSSFEALAILNSHEIRAVVCDNRMPGMNGVAFLARVRQLYPDIVRIMLTGDVTIADKYRVTHEIGVAALLSKPCDPAELAAIIQEYIHPESRPVS